MSSVGAPRHDPVPIGRSRPPFVNFPIHSLFAARAARLRRSRGHRLRLICAFWQA